MSKLTYRGTESDSWLDEGRIVVTRGEIAAMPLGGETYSLE